MNPNSMPQTRLLRTTRAASLSHLGLVLALVGCTSSGTDDAATGGGDPSGGAGAGSQATGGQGTGGEQGSGGHIPVDPSCHLDGAAFCDAFTQPSPGGRAGALDDAKWGFSRLGFGASNGGSFAFPKSPINVCGTWNTVAPGGPDSDFCVGEDGVARWAEGFDDNSDFQYLSARIRQPFDFAGRTGTLQWEADARTSGTHGWWVEVWFTEDPVPGANFHAPDQLVSSANAVGVVLGLNCGINAANLGTEGAGKVGVSEILVVRDYAVETTYNGANVDNSRCVDSEQGVLNKFQFKLSEGRIEVFGTHAGSEEYVSLGESDLNLPFSRGYVHLSHVHYNAHKAEVPSFQSYQWARVAFDGPQLPTPRAYSVPDSLSPATASSGNTQEVFHIGYAVTDGVAYDFNDDPSTPKALTVNGVDVSNASGARLVLNTSRVNTGDTIRYRLNGKAWRDYQVPVVGNWARQGFTLPVDVADLVQGDNTIQLATNTEANNMPPNSMHIANIDLEVDVP